MAKKKVKTTFEVVNEHTFEGEEPTNEIVVLDSQSLEAVEPVAEG